MFSLRHSINREQKLRPRHIASVAISFCFLHFPEIRRTWLSPPDIPLHVQGALYFSHRTRDTVMRHPTQSREEAFFSTIQPSVEPNLANPMTTHVHSNNADLLTLYGTRHVPGWRHDTQVEIYLDVSASDSMPPVVSPISTGTGWHGLPLPHTVVVAK